MNTISTPRRLISAVAATALLLLGATTLSATAQQDVGSTTKSTDPVAGHRCSLARVGTHLVRCDDLTGNGVAAPAWVPEN